MLDFAPQQGNQTDLESDDEIYCAACGHAMTRTRWRIAQRDAHEHTVFNPAGRLFTIVCFKEAPGAALHGTSSADFTWFPGYRWTVALCGACGIHIGWRFDASDVFFGLIKPRLRAEKL